MTENTQTAAKPTVWDFLTDEGKALLSGLEGFFKAVTPEVVNAVLPTATATAEAELTAIATGDNKDTGHILAQGARNAEAAAIQVGIQATAQEIAVIGGATHAGAAS